MRNFYSGISNDRTQFLINMNWYKDNDVETCFRLSKNFHGLLEKCSIDKNDFELVYLKFKWVGNTYYPQESNKSEIKVKENQSEYIKSRYKQQIYEHS